MGLSYEVGNLAGIQPLVQTGCCNAGSGMTARPDCMQISIDEADTDSL
jgi:hypothetical protein